MKNYFFIFLTFFVFHSCKNNESGKEDGLLSSSVINNPQSLHEDTDEKPVISFEVAEHDFGKINEGTLAEFAFKFKNTGTKDLVISTATASCGCTVPYYPKNPISPGAGDTIRVTYNSKGRSGIFSKQITVVANTIPSNNILTIKGEVIASPSVQ